MAALLEILFYLVSIVPLTIFRGFVLSKLWLWFVVPLGVVQISIVHAIGFSLVLGFLSLKNNNAEKAKDRAERAGQFFGHMVTPLFAWGFGAIIHSFMQKQPTTNRYLISVSFR